MCQPWRFGRIISGHGSRLTTKSQSAKKNEQRFSGASVQPLSGETLRSKSTAKLPDGSKDGLNKISGFPPKADSKRKRVSSSDCIVWRRSSPKAKGMSQSICYISRLRALARAIRLCLRFGRQSKLPDQQRAGANVYAKQFERTEHGRPERNTDPGGRDFRCRNERDRERFAIGRLTGRSGALLNAVLKFRSCHSDGL